jgi:hypothetical protein
MSKEKLVCDITEDLNGSIDQIIKNLNILKEAYEYTGWTGLRMSRENSGNYMIYGVPPAPGTKTKKEKKA